MKYSEARPKIKSGDVLAWTHRKWGSWNDFLSQLVRFGTQSEYSHVGVAYVTGERVFILESVTSGIRMHPLSQELPFYWLPVDIKWNEDTLVAAMSKMGQRYSKWDGVMSLWKKIKPGDDNRWECAEYTSFILRTAGINIDCRNIPGEVVYWLQSNADSPCYMVLAD
jgi:hypothetical protein